VDKHSENYLKKKQIRGVLLGTTMVALLAATTGTLTRLEPAAPSFDRSLVWISKVERGPMVLKVTGAGKLVPEDPLLPVLLHSRTDIRENSLSLLKCDSGYPDDMSRSLDQILSNSAESLDSQWIVFV